MNKNELVQFYSQFRDNLVFFFNRSNTEEVVIDTIGYNDFKTFPPLRFIRRQTFYTLHYVHSGTGCLFYNDKNYEVGPGQFFFLPPNEDFMYYPYDNDPWQYYFMELHGYKVAELFKEMGFSQNNAVVKAKRPHRINEILTELFQCLINKTELYYKSLSSLYAVASELIGKENSSDKGSDEEITNKIKRLIQVNYYNPEFKIGTISSALHVSHSYIYKIFRKNTGISLSNFLLETRLEHAAELAKIGNIRIKEICERTGFSDEAHFMKIFKKRYGCTVRDYKKKP